MTGLRIVIALIVAAIAMVTLVPMLVLVDLAGGGDGWGLCHGSLDDCRAGFFEGPELLAGLVVLLFLLVMLLRLAMVMRRRLGERRESVGRGQRLRGG